MYILLYNSIKIQEVRTSVNFKIVQDVLCSTSTICNVRMVRPIEGNKSIV